MAAANAQMGTIRLEGNGLLGANACSVLPKPIFGVMLSFRSGSRSRGLGICAPRWWVSTVVASGGAGGRSSAEAVLEKELKFSPAFGDYVKVLESVQTDRSKHRSSDSDPISLRYGLAEKEGSGEVRNKGYKKLVDSRVSPQGRRAHSDRRPESSLDGEKFTHERRAKYLGHERDGKLERNETRRSRRRLEKGAPKNSTAWKGGDKSSGRDKHLRNVSKRSIANIMQGAHSRYLNKEVDYFVDVFKGGSGPKQSGKNGRNERLHERQTNGKQGGGRSTIQEDLTRNCTQPTEHLRSSVRKMSRSDIGKPENNGKLFAGTGLSGNRLQGRMSKIKMPKSVLKKVSTLKGNSDGTLAESEFNRNRFEKDKVYEIEMGQRMEEYEIHENPLSRDNSPSRIDKIKNERQVGSFQCSLPDMKSGTVQQNISLATMDADVGHFGHSPRWNAFDSSREIDEHKNQGHAVKFHGDVGITKKPGSMISKVDVQTGKDAEGHVGDIDLDDRAAFKTFEVFTDIKNRPRVLRMELEERIQNLAKRLNATDVNMPEWQFSKLIHSAKIKFTDHSILRVVQILGAFGNWRRVLQVVEWLQSRERFKSYKSRYIYTTVLSVLGKAKRPIEALNVFYAMREELSSYPDLAAYHCIAVILGQAGLMKELFDVIDCMRAIPEKKFKLGVLQKWDPRLEPDLVVYNAVVNTCVQQKQWEGAFWVLQELKQKGIKPSSATYGLVMEVMLVCGKYNLVHEFFKKVQKNSIPGALNYKVLVNAFWREGKIDEAVSAVKDMERRGIVGSASLYYDFARCLCSAGRCQEALLQIDKLCKVAQKPLVVTYTGLIQTCLDSGSIQNARYIFNQMREFCFPNVVTCNIMLKSYVEHGMFQEANCLFQKILEGSKCIHQKSDMRGKVVPDKFTFNTMMEACYDAKHWDDFEYAYEQMLLCGFHFDAKRHLRMVMEASRAGKVQLLDTTFEHLICSGRTPPPAIVKERFCLRLQDGDCVAALSCLDIDIDILAKLQAYSEKSWLDTLNANLCHLDIAVLIRLASEIDNLSCQSHVKSPVLQNLLNACKKIIKSSTNANEQSNNQRTLPCDM